MVWDIIALIAMLVVFGYPAIKTTIEDKQEAKYLEERIRIETLKGHSGMARELMDELERIKK